MNKITQKSLLVLALVFWVVAKGHSENSFYITALDYKNLPNSYIRFIDPETKKTIRRLDVTPTTEFIWFPGSDLLIHSKLADLKRKDKWILRGEDQSKGEILFEQEYNDLNHYAFLPAIYSPTGIYPNLMNQELVLGLKGKTVLNYSGETGFEMRHEPVSINKFLERASWDKNRATIYLKVKKYIETEKWEGESFALGELVREGILAHFVATENNLYAITHRPAHSDSRIPPEIQLIHLDPRGEKILKKRVLPQPSSQGKNAVPLKAYLNQFCVIDGTLNYLFIGFGNENTVNPVQIVWVYDVAEGRAVKKYQLEIPLESVVRGQKKGMAYASRSQGDNVDNIFEFTVESEETQPQSWPVSGRLLLLERRIDEIRQYQKW